MVAQNLQRFFARSGFKHRVTPQAECAAGKGTNRGLILDQKDHAVTLPNRDPAGVGGGLRHLLWLLIDPVIFSTFVAAFFASLAWMAAMTRFELSYAYPFTSLNFAAVLLLSAALLGDLGHALDEDVLVCGDAKADKQQVIALIEQIDGLRCVDCGKLEMARLTEQLTPLLIGINIRYKTHAGIRITGLPERA